MPATNAIATTTRSALLQTRTATTAQKASNSAREKSMHRDIVLNYVTELMAVTHAPLTTAVELLLQRAQDRALPAHIYGALKACAVGKSEYPSRSSLCLWHKNRREGGIDALIPQHKGKVRQTTGWEARAIELYQQPSKPNMSSVYRILTEVENYECSYAQVTHYLNSLPAQLGRNSQYRLGKNLHRLTQKSYVQRTTQTMRVGDVYVADGYRADVYLAHPLTGDIFRPELTVAMDLRSRFIVGWRLDEHEGSFAVQSMWAETFARHNHVPPLLYIDNGSGYRNSFVDDETTGFYARAGVSQIIHSIPGNPHGKGWIERFFRIMKEDFLKNWQPAYYCGDDMADEVRNKVVRDLKANRIVLPSVKQFADAFNAWLDRHHARPHPEDNTTTPAKLWSQLDPIPPAISVLELKRRVIKLTVRRASIKHKKLSYRHPDLMAFNGQKVTLEYDFMDNHIAIVRTLDGVWICDAQLVTEKDAIPVSRLEEQRQIRVEQATKRLEKKIAEQTARAGRVIDANSIVDDVVALTDQRASELDDKPDLILDLY